MSVMVFTIGFVMSVKGEKEGEGEEERRNTLAVLADIINLLSLIFNKNIWFPPSFNIFFESITMYYIFYALAFHGSKFVNIVL
jgi:hypothetical protein